MAQGRLNKAAVKIFIRMLGEKDVLSTMDPEGLVWLEGRLLSVDEAKNIAVLFDSTGKARIDYSSVRKLRSQKDGLISADSYVMIVGKVESYPPDPLIKAIKISPISSSEVEEVMWGMEVEDQHREVYRKRYQKRIKKYGDPMALCPLGY
ncbi:recQ-mediated genome instability protein 2-like [Lytechinus variegatus]|uniref:recQ-mediated genome instability protein 2-like n=1 Tax=Lytechinus variegatus TaxID=7654 RepID=UPI001BB148A5|nr:recQ-mediated genome instability protein 2-like [Lytechinus variegatus]XP_041476001.1 recQ-mediated genome instability protein 2-like [Lytechinus variegatus]